MDNINYIKWNSASQHHQAQPLRHNAASHKPIQRRINVSLPTIPKHTYLSLYIYATTMHHYWILSKRAYEKRSSIITDFSRGRYPIRLILGVKCKKSGSVCVYTHTTDDLIPFQCMSCANEWIICTECNRVNQIINI